MSCERLRTALSAAERYTTSRTTVQKSVKKLVAEGILVTRHGWGTFVADGP
jgi:DNA-binding GntR family transcriptional regulator